MAIVTTVTAVATIAVAMVTSAIIAIATITTVAVVGTSPTVPVTSTIPTLCCVLLELLIVSTHFAEQLFAQFLGFGNAFWLWSGNVEEHGFVALLAGGLFHES